MGESEGAAQLPQSGRYWSSLRVFPRPRQTEVPASDEPDVQVSGSAQLPAVGGTAGWPARRPPRPASPPAHPGSRERPPCPRRRSPTTPTPASRRPPRSRRGDRHCSARPPRLRWAATHRGAAPAASGRPPVQPHAGRPRRGDRWRRVGTPAADQPAAGDSVAASAAASDDQPAAPAGARGHTRTGVPQAAGARRPKSRHDNDRPGGTRGRDRQSLARRRPCRVRGSRRTCFHPDPPGLSRRSPGSGRPVAHDVTFNTSTRL